MSITTRAILLAVILAAAVAGWWQITAHYEAIGYGRAQAEYQAAAELQREANRTRATTAETKYTPQAEVRERFIVTTVKELTNATASLAACPVGADAVRLFNAAAACANSAAACGPDLPLPGP